MQILVVGTLHFNDSENYITLGEIKFDEKKNIPSFVSYLSFFLFRSTEVLALVKRWQPMMN